MAIIFGVTLVMLTLVLGAIAAVCILSSYRTVWHIVGVIQRKEKLAFDFHLFTVICTVFILFIIVIVWPMAMYHLWISKFG